MKPYLMITQNGSARAVHDKSKVRLDRANFALVFPLRDYDDKNNRFYNVRITGSQNKMILRLKEGVSVDMPNNELFFFSGGRGLASGDNGSYDEFVLSDQAHHYLIHDPGNSRARRVQHVRRLLTGLSEVRFDIKKFQTKGRAIPCKRLNFNELHFVVFMDANLNRTIDPGELFRFTAVFPPGSAGEQ